MYIHITYMISYHITMYLHVFAVYQALVALDFIVNDPPRAKARLQLDIRDDIRDAKRSDGPASPVEADRHGLIQVNYPRHMFNIASTQ